ncbi:MULTISPECIES: protein translocase subunit SecF [unclassified Actinotalea]|uniref:protein translocase subunit SecF n=1 Tax=unclassified Actinotalea TaxID=2638618 RepID=UPI0015F5D117|nr:MULTISPECIES: protein translocase subunit SecF [unclassified Actinotalea]
MPSRVAQWGNDLYTGKRSYDIVGRRMRWLAIGGAVILASIALLLVRGINPSIEFSGGAEFTVTGAATTEQQPALDVVAEVAPEEVPRVSGLGDSSVRVQTGELEQDVADEIASGLAEAYDVPLGDVSTSLVGPSWGADVTAKAVQGLVIFLLLVAVVMTLYFRAWRMAAAALFALAHDLIITVGVYAGIGWEVSPATVIGFLTILGYSLYDTVVVFDKVRENTEKVLEQRRYTYAELANLAVNQTLVRSINTSVVALLPVSAILFIGAFLLGAGTLRDIALALFIGMSVGTLSSVFIATPFEVFLREREPAIREHTARVLEARKATAPADADPAEAVKVHVGAPVPGGHLGNSAQPRRRKPNRPAGRKP